MPNSFLLSAGLVAGFVLWPQTARAQSAPTYSLAITEPYEVVEAVGTTRRITRAEIDARNARTLDEALRLVPGIHVRTGGDGTPRIDIRGFRSRHVLLLVNGVQVNSTADGQFDPARIPTAAIREIKVSYGSSSILYGDNAMAAVIEITTVNGDDGAAGELSAGSPRQWGGGGRVSRGFGGFTLNGAATAFDTGGFRLPGSFAPTPTEDGGRRDNSDRTRADVRGSVSYAASPSMVIGTEWTLGTGSYGLPTTTVADSTDVFAPPLRYERLDDYRTVSGQLSMVLSRWPRFNLRAWLYRNSQRETRSRYDDATYSSMDDPLVPGTFSTRERTTITGSTALARIDLRRLGWLRAAINQRREAFGSNGVIRDVAVSATGGGTGTGGGRGGGSGRPPTPYDLRTFGLDRRVDVYSAGTEWQAQPGSRLGTVVGAGVTWHQREDGSTESAPTWIAGTTYDATSSWRLHASVARKIRVPSIDQLYSESSGNPALRPEHAYGVDVGADGRVGAATVVGVSAFVTYANDFIERLPNEPFANQQEYRFSGGDVTWQTNWARTDWRGAYTFLDAVDLRADAPNRQLQTRPRHRASLQWAWPAGAVSTFRGTASYTGSQLFDSRGAEPVQRRVGGYALLDLGFTQALGRRYTLAFDVSNVFDRLYAQAYGLPREGRAAVLTLRALTK